MVKSHTALTYVRRALCGVALIPMLAIGAAAQDASAAEAQYAALLKQISDMKISIAHKEAVIATQQGQIKDLQGQIDRVDEVTASVGPMIDKMAAAISDEIEKDIPFASEERYERLGKFQDTIADPEARPGDKMRRALNIYQAEVNYGQTFAYYMDNHPVPEKQGSRLAACLEDQDSGACALTQELRKKLDNGATIEGLKSELKDGNYLRYGRLALIYAQADGSDVYAYDAASKVWEPVTGGRALDYVRAVKMARGEAAVDVVTAPVLMAK